MLNKLKKSLQSALAKARLLAGGLRHIAVPLFTTLAAVTLALLAAKYAPRGPGPDSSDRLMVCQTPAGEVELHLKASSIIGLGDPQSTTYQFTAPNDDVLTVSKSDCVVIKEASAQPPQAE